MLIYFIVLLEGFVTISLEILTIRQLIPIVGNSIIVTSLIIGIFLLFLAYGYRKGGCYQDNFIPILRRNFLLSAAGFGIGLSYLFIEMFFQLTQFTPTLVSLLLYLLLVTAPVVYLLGQTVPITLNLWKKQTSVGEVGGQVLHVSTIGSFLGATITTLVLMHFLGVAASIFIDFTILIFLILLLDNFKLEMKSFATIVFLGATIYWANVIFEKSYFTHTNNYGNYTVWQQTDKKILAINDSSSSSIDLQNKGFSYIEKIKKIIFDDLNLKNKKILVLGAGGFTLSAEKTNQNHFLYVDIDDQIKKIVQNYFLRDVQGEFIADDARHFLKTTPEKFDVIVNDTYSNRQTIAAHLLTREYFSSLKAALAPNGIAIFNIIARPTFDDNYSARVNNTLHTVFSNCVTEPLTYSSALTNIIYICRNSNSDKAIYTDDLNQATLDFFKM